MQFGINITKMTNPEIKFMVKKAKNKEEWQKLWNALEW